MKRNRPFTARVRIQMDRWTVVRIALIILGISAALYVVVYLTRLEFFRIKEVIVREGGVVVSDAQKDFRYLVGRNTFTLDLRKEARRIQMMHPGYRTAHLIRYLPDRLCVDILKRSPVACIKGRRIFYLDDRSTLFEASLQSLPQNIPVITGIEKKVSVDQVGRRCSLPEAAFALTVIKETRGKLQPYTLAAVDVSSLDSLVMILSNGVQVKLGRELLAEKLQLLANLLMQVKTSLPSIDYIDLRFKEPVIKFKQSG
jgi:cell division septal protein FtsQ